MMDPKVSQDAAEAEFERFLIAMDIEVDESLDESDRKGFDKLKQTLVRAIMRGRLVVNEKGEPVYTPAVAISGIVSLTLREPTGAALRAASTKRDEQAKMQEILASMSGQPSVTFANMAVRDFKICAAVVTAFLA